jgi:hypothetical protein
MTINNIPWKILFERHNILQEIEQAGFFKISANQINTEREARLMAKFDHQIQLPKIFKDNNLSILPISRGSYIIGSFDSYFKIAPNPLVEIKHVNLPDYIQTIDPSNISSESTALLCANLSEMFSSILEEKVELTVLGRMSSGSFEFEIKNITTGQYQSISVNRSQCEIDGGLEGENVLAIVEAKTEEVFDFHIRQLYYPYRLWQSKTTKKVIPIFMYFSNDIFSFFVFKFNDDSKYNSIELVSQHKFSIASSEIELNDLEFMLSRVQITPEPNTPFPQANHFPRIIDLLNLLKASDGKSSSAEITENYAFDERQTHYYTSAANYLGLVERSGKRNHIEYRLTAKGKSLMQLNSHKRKLLLAETILSHQIFNATFNLYLRNAQPPTKEQILEFMRLSNLRCNSTTMARRSGTVRSWLDWILSLTRS